jgi:uncharacterized protein (DUF2062 family)
MRRLNRWGLSRQKLRGGFLHSKLGDRILERELWIPDRESLARAWLVGMPVTAIPFLPGQSLIACAIGFFVRANLPVTFLLQYLSNPATAIFQLSACYFTGNLVLGTSPKELIQLVHSKVDGFMASPSLREALHAISWHDLATLYLGSVILGVALGLLGYSATHLLWRPKAKRLLVRSKQ